MNITPAQLDAITELVNIGLGRAASILNEMATSHVRLTTPRIEALSLKEILMGKGRQLNATLSSVKMSFTGMMYGSAYLAFPPESALRLVSLLTGEDRESPDLDSLKLETLNEVGNIVLNGVLGSIANALDGMMNYTIPSYQEDTLERMFVENVEEDDTVVLAVAEFSVEDQNIRGDTLLILEPKSFAALLTALEPAN
ncbi:MAG: chemotaxis protein CheC [Nitrospinae bacterium]|nr:chemotaxis protein CheC [Nitrospinota bacterium]MBF0634228.1 chemotaxis protein CheC [Nitrospinota bacterium]